MIATDEATLSFTRWRLDLRAVDPVRFGTYPGSAFRGGLGEALKDVACLDCIGCPTVDGESDAPVCRQPLDCLFGYAFESRRPGWAGGVHRGSHVPHPFILEPPLKDRRVYEPGEVLSLGLGLVGMARSHFWRFAEAFARLGRNGIGTGRGRLDLVCARQTDDIAVPVAGLFAFQSLEPIGRIEVQFLTPARLQDENGPVERIAFPVLVRRLVERLRDLLHFHCGQEIEADSSTMLDLANEVQVVAHPTRWEDRVRYRSRRESRRKTLGGVVGPVVYAGPVGPFIPLLRVAEYLHVGKGTAFGFGRLRVVVRDGESLTTAPEMAGSEPLRAGGEQAGGPGNG